MNAVGSQKLPQNLKSLFRTTAVVTPDRLLIISTTLMSCGFIASSVLAQKIRTLYALCEEQLTQQVHLRPVLYNCRYENSIIYCK